MMPSMDYLPMFGLYSLLIPILMTIAALLLLYGVVRVAVSRGLRDHHRWLQSQAPNPPRDDWPIGQ